MRRHFFSVTFEHEQIIMCSKSLFCCWMFLDYLTMHIEIKIKVVDVMLCLMAYMTHLLFTILAQRLVLSLICEVEAHHKLFLIMCYWKQ